MRAVLQRVTEASVKVDGKTVGEIGPGLLVLLGVFDGDGTTECDILAEKTAVLRIFEDDGGRMNRSLCDVGGSVLVVSQFTLCADCKKGRRPSFMRSAKPDEANALYERYQEHLRNIPGVREVQSGIFGADMKVALVNDGPVTILLDTDEL